MKNIYIGKKSITGQGVAICKVLDTNIATGDSIIFNRETGKIEILYRTEKRYLDPNIKKLAEDTEQEHTEKAEQEFSKMNRY